MVFSYRGIHKTIQLRFCEKMYEGLEEQCIIVYSGMTLQILSAVEISSVILLLLSLGPSYRKACDTRC